MKEKTSMETLKNSPHTIVNGNYKIIKNINSSLTTTTTFQSTVSQN
jgi:hypothetical protein